MKLKSIKISEVLCSILILSIFGVFASSSDMIPQDNSDSDSLMIGSMTNEKYMELYHLRETTVQQRNEMIKKIMNIVSDPNSRRNLPAFYTAIEILGDIRAVEATDLLLDIVDYSGRANPGGSNLTQFNPMEFKKRFPAIGSVIKIHPSYEGIIRRLGDEDNVGKKRCYITILLGTEGLDVSQYLIEKAIQGETETRKIERLNSALNVIKESIQ